MDNQSQFFYSSIFKISISPKNYHFSSLDWAFKLICEKSGFTIELPLRFRHEVMNAIINKVHEVTKSAGFKRIITEMGTEAGAKFLCKKHNYVHTPTENQQNRWTKELI